MAVITDEQARASIRQGTDRINAVRRRKMIAGRLDANGVETLAGAPAGTTYVRSSPESREQTVAYGSASPAGAPVIVVQDYDGSLYIDQPDWAEAVKRMGDAAKTITVVRGYDELLPKNIDALGFKPGRVGVSTLGGTNVSIEPFVFNGVLVSLSDVDVGSYYPGAADTYGRVGLYYNPSTGAAVAFAGSSNTDLAQLIAIDDQGDVPAGTVPLGAVIVSTDSAGDPNDITNANWFENWRGFLAPNGHLLTGDAVTCTIASGVISVGAESIVVAAAESGTTDDLNTLTVSGTPRMGWIVADTGDTITIKHGVDNISCFGAADVEITDASAAVWMYDGTTVYIAGGSGGGAFTDLTDTPASYSGAGDQAVFVNAGETALEFRDAMPVASKTRWVGTVLWDKTNGSAGSFDSNNTDDLGNSGAFGTDYDLIEGIWLLRGAAAAAAVVARIAINNDTTATNYQRPYDFKGSADGQGLTNNSRDVQDIAGDSATANYFSSGRFFISNPGSAAYKAVVSKGDDPRSSSAHLINDYDVLWRNTAAITRIALDVNNATTTFVTGSRLILIGWKLETIGGIAYAEDAISATPTDAELDGIFGAPASLPTPFTAVVKDSGDNTNQWLVWSDGSQWLGVQASVLT